MKAIVLTCDKYRALTDHMIFKYDQLWPDHPFHFRIPFQEIAPTITTDKVEYKKTQINIKLTVLTLLEDLEDEEIIYWCIDDKYPIKIDVPKIEKMYLWFAKEKASSVSGLLFCRCRKMWNTQCLSGKTVVDDSNNVYLERKGYQQLWIHQFLRVKVLRYLFNSLPDVNPFPVRLVGYYIKHITKPFSHNIFVSRQNWAVFGESTIHGVVTRNCYRSILENGLDIPTWCAETTNNERFIGTLSANINDRLYYFIKRIKG